eukprot:gb/GEZN01001104.1/.p1 GENE.gb/GEZN01001104.1/~~gb/GEZN01001104.1/.p1  ORF type:complete len:1074 (+),score=133.15 gb/GEZN01001104.1/:55-3276(+)
MECSRDNVLRIAKLLERGLHHDQGQRKLADDELSNLKKMAGFRSCLLAILTTRSFALQQRLLGATTLKNNISNYFGLVIQKRTPEEITAQNQEKEFLKAKLLVALEEPENKIATQLAAIISAIAAYEWPRNWQALFPALASQIQSGSNLLATRSLYTLHQVQKKLSKKRMSMSRMAFCKAAQELLPLLKGMWTAQTKTLMMGLQNISKQCPPPQPLEPSPQQLPPLQLAAVGAELTLKCLHRVIVIGVPDPDTNEDIQSLFSNFLSLLPSLCLLRSRLLPSSVLFKHVSKSVRVMARTVVETQVAQPLKFRKFLVGFALCFEQSLATAVDKKGLVFEKYTVQSLTYLTKVVSCPQYSGTGSKVGASFSADRGVQFDASAVQDAQRTLLQHFNQERVTSLAKLLMSQLLLLRQADLTKWQSEPEIYLKEESSLKAEEKARPAAEALLKALMAKFHGWLGPLVLQSLQEVVRKPANDMPSLLMKESVLHAVGIGSDALGPSFQQHKFDFVQLYTKCLASELNSTSDVQKITRRRVIWVIGEFALQVPDNLRGTVYGHVKKLLEERDLVVRLTAAEALRSLVGNLNFHTAREHFLPHGPAILERLFALVSECVELESKSDVMILVSQIVEQLGPTAKGMCGSILKHLPPIWEASEGADVSLIRVPLMSLLKSLVDAAGPDSQLLHSFVVPLLDKTLSASGPLIYLQEAALDLWVSVMKQAPAYSDGLHSLFSHWLVLQQGGTLHLQVLMALLESYLMLGQLTFVRAHAGAISSCLNGLITTNPSPERASFTAASSVLDDDGLVIVLSVIEPFIQLFPDQTLTGFEPLLSFVVVEIVKEAVYCAKKAQNQNNNKTMSAKRLGANGVFHDSKNVFSQQEEHHAEQPPTHISRPDKLLAVYFTLLGRMVLQSYAGAMRLLSGASRDQCPPELLISLVMDVWLDKIDAMKAQYQKKMACLGLVTLLASNNRQVLSRLSPILFVVNGVLSEEGEESDQVKQLRNAQVAQAQAVAANRRTELERLRLMSAADPAERVGLRDYCISKLQQCRTRCGDPLFREVLKSVDNSIMAEFRKLANPGF